MVHAASLTNQTYIALSNQLGHACSKIIHQNVNNYVNEFTKKGPLFVRKNPPTELPGYGINHISIFITMAVLPQYCTSPQHQSAVNFVLKSSSCNFM